MHKDCMLVNEIYPCPAHKFYNKFFCMTTIYVLLQTSSISFSKNACLLSALLSSTDWKYRSHLKAISNESNDLLNDTHGEMARAGWVILVLRHHETIHTDNFHRKGYLMLHHLAGATIQVANFVNFNCHPSRGLQ